MSAPLAGVDIGALVRRSRGRAGRAASDARGAVLARLRKLVRVMDWSLRIPGQHYSGLSNQEMLDVRQSEGRDFAADTTALRIAVLATLLVEYEGATEDPSPADIRRTIRDAIVEHVLRRINGAVRDVRIPLLTPAYAARKRKAGKGGEPVGVWTGDWRDAVERAEVAITGIAA
jgi:hypothetical protein